MTRSRYAHTISLTKEQEEKLQAVREKTELSIPEILMVAVDKLHGEPPRKTAEQY